MTQKIISRFLHSIVLFKLHFLRSLLLNKTIANRKVNVLSSPKGSILLATLLIFPILLSAQYKKKKSPIRWGIQSGVHLSFLTIEESPVDKEPFLGLGFGIIARKKLLDTKFSWANWKHKTSIHLETGLIGLRDGYQYSFADQIIDHNEFSLSIPIVFIIRGDDNRFHKQIQKKGLKVVVRSGVSLNLRKRKEINKEYTNSTGTLKFKESSTQTTRMRVPFYGGLGLEKQRIDGGRSYCGISIHMSSKPTISGEIILDQSGQQKRGFLSKHVFYYSIDLQYFFGKRKRIGQGKLPPIIFNPRFSWRSCSPVAI